MHIQRNSAQTLLLTSTTPVLLPCLLYGCMRTAYSSSVTRDISFRTGARPLLASVMQVDYGIRCHTPAKVSGHSMSIILSNNVG